MYVVNIGGSVNGIYDRHSEVVRYYNIPTLVYDLSTLRAFAVTERHPPWPWHQFIADYLAWTWKYESLKVCGYHLKKPIEKYAYLRNMLNDFCVQPNTLYRADHPASFEKAFILTDNKWKYGEDIKGGGKFGWYIDDLIGGKITFTINIDYILKINTKTTTIGIGYLKSYEGMGIVKVYTNEDTNRYMFINGTNDNPNHHASMIYSTRVCVPVESNKDTHDSDASLPDDSFQLPDCNAEHESLALKNKVSSSLKPVNLTIELLPAPNGVEHNKFKIVFVMSC